MVGPNEGAGDGGVLGMPVGSGEGFDVGEGVGCGIESLNDISRGTGW